MSVCKPHRSNIDLKQTSNLLEHKLYNADIQK